MSKKNPISRNDVIKKQEARIRELETINKDIDQQMTSRIDGWANVLVGLGQNIDKRHQTSFEFSTYISDEELSDIYAAEGIGKKIIDVIADDMTRKWISLENDEDEKVLNFLSDLKAESKFNLALKWSRLYGGSMILIGALDGGEIENPLNPKSIKDIEYLKVIDKTQIDISRSIYQNDTSKKGYGEIEKYYVYLYNLDGSFEAKYIHASRVVCFFGEPVPSKCNGIGTNTKYWGFSSLQAIYESIRDVGGIMGSVANVLYEFVLIIYKFKGLSGMLARGKESRLINRLQTVGMTKSMFNAVVMGEEEEFIRNTANVTGLSDVIDRFFTWISAVTNIPQTRLFGMVPSGLSTDDNSGIRTYYDMIQSKQKNQLLYPLQYVVDLISGFLGVSDVTVKFNPLMQNTEKENAEIDKLNAEAEKTIAETIEKYLMNGILDNRMFDEYIEKIAGRLMNIMKKE